MDEWKIWDPSLGRTRPMTPEETERTRETLAEEVRTEQQEMTERNKRRAVVDTLSIAVGGLFLMLWFLYGVSVLGLGKAIGITAGAALCSWLWTKAVHWWIYH
jgi:hypothetical protein